MTKRLSTAQVDQLLAQLKLTRKTADILLIGDGSGQYSENPCGWAAAGIIVATGEFRPFFGAMSSGSNQVGEFMPYCQALSYYAIQRKKQQHLGVCRVHIATDAEYIRDIGQGKRKVCLSLELWNVFMAHFRRLGFGVHWHWLPRETLALNAWADKTSRDCRLLLEGFGKGVVGYEKKSLAKT
jgi:hypothetical protein